MKRLVLPIAGVLLLVLAVAQVRATRESAPSAVAPATAPARASLVGEVVAEGRVVTRPDSQAVVAAEISGTIEAMHVREKDVVRRGQPIATLRADDVRAARAEAKARLGEADADIRLAELEADRARRLAAEGVAAPQLRDARERDLDAARARRVALLAEVRRLDAVLAKSVVRAPIDGVVVDRPLAAGESVLAGGAVATVADLGQTRIEAEIDEYDSGRVAVGGHATITVEGTEGSWKGTVEEIPDAVVSRRLKPQDPSKPVDTRVLLVKVALAEKSPLRLGQRVEVRLSGR